jgi:hypothetical protein
VWFIIALLLAAIWVCQFADLMSLADQEFPGSHDKLLWGAAFLLFSPLAPLAFLYYKGAYIAVSDRREQTRN